MSRALGVLTLHSGLNCEVVWDWVKVKVKVPCPEGVGEVLISHTVAIEPVGG